MAPTEELAPRRSQAVRLPAAFRGFLTLSAALLAGSALFVSAAVRNNPAPHHGLPLDIYTRLPFYDLVGLVLKMPQVHEAAFFGGAWPYTYPAPSVLIFGFFALFAHLPIKHPFLGSVAAYLLFAAAGLLFLCHRFSVAVQARGVPRGEARVFAYGTLLLSWPILYGVHQGNLDVLLWMGVAAAIWLYRRERWWAFALLVGVVGSFKIFPLIFLLVLPLKRWKEIVGGVLAFVLMNVACLLYIGPTLTVAAQKVAGGIALYNRMGMSVQGVPLSSKPFDHSLHGLLHRVLSFSPVAVGTMNRMYIPCAAVLFLALYFGRVRKLARANQVLFLTLAAVTLPSTSFDYTLQMLYVPFACIWLDALAAGVWEKAPRWLVVTMVCFALVLSPELFLSVRGVLFYGQFKAVVLLVLFAVCVAFDFGERAGTRLVVAEEA